MLHDLIQNRKGKNTIVMTDTLTKVNNRMKELRKSHRTGVNGDKVIYSVKKSSSVDKFEKKPAKSWRNYHK